LVSIGLVLSEEKIFEKVYDERRTDDDNGRQVMAIAHLTLWVGSGELIKLYSPRCLENIKQMKLYSMGVWKLTNK
jgi:hypothetical protein